MGVWCEVTGHAIYEGIRIREFSIDESYVHCCTVEDLIRHLERFDREDLSGLHQISLGPVERMREYADARYRRYPRPSIHLYPLRRSLEYKVRHFGSCKDPALAFSHQCAYGMKAERQGIGWLCRWEFVHWKKFILEFVLAHEIGHHVHYMKRKASGLTCYPPLPASEQFADDYANRFLARLKRSGAE